MRRGSAGAAFQLAFHVCLSLAASQHPHRPSPPARTLVGTALLLAPSACSPPAARGSTVHPAPPRSEAGPGFHPGPASLQPFLGCTRPTYSGPMTAALSLLLPACICPGSLLSTACPRAFAHSPAWKTPLSRTLPLPSSCGGVDLQFSSTPTRPSPNTHALCPLSRSPRPRHPPRLGLEY